MWGNWKRVPFLTLNHLCVINFSTVLTLVVIRKYFSIYRGNQTNLKEVNASERFRNGTSYPMIFFKVFIGNSEFQKLQNKTELNYIKSYGFIILVLELLKG